MFVGARIQVCGTGAILGEAREKHVWSHGIPIFTCLKMNQSRGIKCERCSNQLDLDLDHVALISRVTLQAS